MKPVREEFGEDEMSEIINYEASAAELRPAEAASDPMIAMIERVMMAPDLPIERVSSIMDLRERQMQKEAEQEFNRAFAAAMAEMPVVRRTGWNPHLKRKYATLDDLIVTSRPVLARHGLSLNWETGIDGNQIWVRAIVRHASGHQINTEERGPRDSGKAMNALQGGGSTQTYLKRYSGFAILGMAAGDEADDDGIHAEAEPITEAEVSAIAENIRGKDTREGVIGYLKTLDRKYHTDNIKKIASDHLATLPGGDK